MLPVLIISIILLVIILLCIIKLTKGYGLYLPHQANFAFSNPEHTNISRKINLIVTIVILVLVDIILIIPFITTLHR